MRTGRWRANAVLLLAGGIIFVPGRARAELFSKDILQLRDPFKKPTASASAETAISELEQFPVERFKYMGVVIGTPHKQAMLRGPNGKPYFVREGTRIGLRKGVITHITPERIIVREKFVNVLGQEEVTDVTIELPPEQLAGMKR